MTVIIGLEHNGNAYIGADSAMCGSNWTRQTGYPKVVRVGKFAIASTGYYRAAQVLEHALDVRLQEGDETDMAYMVTEFVPAVRDLLKDHGWARVDSNREANDGAFLIGYRGRVYAMESNYQLIRPDPDLPFLCYGAGEEYAYAAMYLLRDVADPIERIDRAVDVCYQFTPGAVQPPTLVLQA